MRKKPNLRLVNGEFFDEAPASGRKPRTGTQRNATRDARIEAGEHRKRNDDNQGKKNIKLEARSEGQKILMETIDRCDITLAIGPAGTGKTVIAVTKAVTALDEGRVKRIIITRPAVEAGEKLGFLPGTMQEKLDPYMRPIFDALLRCMSPQRMTALINERTIEIAPIGFMRGRTLSECAIIIDEGQNATQGQLRMLLTRLGMGSFMVITGDPEQPDLDEGDSGLTDVADKMEGTDARIGVVRMGYDDVVRHPLVRKMVKILAA